MCPISNNEAWKWENGEAGQLCGVEGGRDGGKKEKNPIVPKLLYLIGVWVPDILYQHWVNHMGMLIGASEKVFMFLNAV